MNEIDTRSKARRAQGGKGLLSHTISVQESQTSISKILILEKKREEQEEREEERLGEGGGALSRPQEGGGVLSRPQKRGIERVRG